MSEESVSVEEETEPMQKVSGLVLRSESQDLIVKQQARIAEMQYSKHEFVKMTEVQRLINEALEQIFDRFQKKDKLLSQHKMQLRQQDTKLKQIEQSVVSLMKMTPQHNAVFKQIKDFKSDIERVLKERDNDKQGLDYTISAVNLRINNSNQVVDQLRTLLDHHEQRWQQGKMDALSVSEGVDVRIMKSRDEMQQEFNRLEGQYRELGVQNENLVNNYDKLQGEILKQNSLDVSRIVESIRMDSDRVFKMENQMRELLKTQDQIKSVDEQCKYLMSRVEEARMCQQYIETVLPLQMHVQSLQAVSLVVTNETQQQQLQQYDIEQLRSLKPLSMQETRNKYLQLAKFCRDYGEGTCQIDLNADFNPAFFKMQLDHHRQMLQKQIAVETINREQMVSKMLKEHEKQQPKIMQTAQKRPSVIIRAPSIAEPRRQSSRVEQPVEPPMPQVPVPAPVPVPATTTVVEQKIVTNNITNTTIQNKLVTITKTDLKSQHRIQLQFKHLSDSMKRQMRSLKQTVIDSMTEVLQDQDRLDQKQEYQSKSILQIVMFLQSPSNKPQDLTKQIEKLQKQLVSIQRKPITKPPPQPPTPPLEPVKKQFSTKQLLKFQDDIQASVTQSMQQFNKNIEEFNFKLDIAHQELQLLATTLKMQVEISIQEALNKQALASQEQSAQFEQKCLDTFKDVQLRQGKVESLCQDQEARTLAVIQLQEEFTELFKRDYDQFVRDRKRWKADFSLAAQNQIKNVEDLQGYVQQSLTQQQSISKALKLMNDAQMIQQLIETQDFEDKKRIGLLGAEAIKVDRGCLQCSGNQSQVVHQLKLACMGYSQTPITYKEQQYYVGDLIKTKGKVVAQTQRILRDALDKNELVYYNDERSYIIEQMLGVKPIVQPSTAMTIERDAQNVIVHTQDKMRPKSVLDSTMLKTMYSSIPSVPDWTQSRLGSHDVRAEIKTRNIKRVLTMTQQPVKF